jgi:hypothetical protein
LGKNGVLKADEAIRLRRRPIQLRKKGDQIEGGGIERG